MAATPSTMLSLGTPVPVFTLTNTVDGKEVASRASIGRSGLLVTFICNHCPYVIHLRKDLVKRAQEWVGQGINVLAINSNSEVTHPGDGPVHMKALATSEKWGFPFLFDATQEVAKQFKAACTPEFYLFDGKGKLVYRGQFDDSRPKNGLPVTGKDLGAAVDALLKGAEPLPNQKPSIGCNVKWAPGNEPDYAR